MKDKDHKSAKNASSFVIPPPPEGEEGEKLIGDFIDQTKGKIIDLEGKAEEKIDEAKEYATEFVDQAKDEIDDAKEKLNDIGDEVEDALDQDKADD